MVLTNAVKQDLRDSADMEPEQVSTRSSQAVRLTLASGRKVLLFDASGRVTAAGTFWYKEVHNTKPPNVGWDAEAEILRKHKTDYIVMRDGKTKKDLRTWRPELNRFDYTAVSYTHLTLPTILLV